MTMKMSILSHSAAQSDQIQTLGGKIRPGIKVLKRAALENKFAVEIYKKGVSRRLKFSEIEKEITEVTKISNPLYPKNTPFYNVASSDFGMPEVAAKIMEMYGEIRPGDPEVRLYRFPVVFHSDDLNMVYPNEFKRYGTLPHFESHYGEDNKRYCRFLPPVTPEMVAFQKANRIKRPPRREKVVRGLCDPNVCNEFLRKECKFKGRLHFYIPGLPSGLLGMDTSSDMAALDIYKQLKRDIETFGGIPRVNPNKPGSPIYYISKVQKERGYFDEDGNAKSGLQWVPHLESVIDTGTVIANGYNPQLSHSAPVAWLHQPKGMPEALVLGAPETQGETITTAEGEVISSTEPVQQASCETNGSESETKDEGAMALLLKLADEMQLSNEDLDNFFTIKLGDTWTEDDKFILGGIELLKKLQPYGLKQAKQVMLVTVLCTEMGLDSQILGKYATLKYGKGYLYKETLLTGLLDELNGFKTTDIESVKSFIMAQIENACPV